MSSQLTATTAWWARRLISRIAHNKLTVWVANLWKDNSKLTLWVIMSVHCEVTECPQNEPTVSFNVSSHWVSCELKFFKKSSITLSSKKGISQLERDIFMKFLWKILKTTWNWWDFASISKRKGTKTHMFYQVINIPWTQNFSWAMSQHFKAAIFFVKSTAWVFTSTISMHANWVAS